MPELRWILLVAGIVLIGVVYYLGRRSPGEDTVSNTAERQTPRLGGDSSADIAHTADARRAPQLSDSADILLSEPELGDSAHASVRPVKKKAPNLQRPAHEQKIVTIRVSARGSERLSGEQLVAALRKEGLEHGQFNIFHRHADNSVDSDAVFSVASMVEPGHFDLEKLDEIQTPGISLFMLLPGPKDGTEAFSDMLTTARRLAETLNADVLDEVGSTLSRQAESHLREEIVNYQHRLATLRSS